MSTLVGFPDFHLRLPDNPDVTGAAARCFGRSVTIAVGVDCTTSGADVSRDGIINSGDLGEAASVFKAFVANCP